MEGREYLSKAQEAREGKRFDESLRLLNEAIAAFGEEKDMGGAAEGYAAMAITYRIMAGKSEGTEKQRLLEQAEEAALKGISIASESGKPEANIHPEFLLAQVYEDQGEIHDAVDHYKKSVELLNEHKPKDLFTEPVLANFHLHLATCQLGITEDATARKDLYESAVRDIGAIQQSHPDDYTKLVWISGGHMRIAKMLADSDRKLALQHLLIAEEIIKSDPRLEIRAQQMERLKKQLEIEK